MYFFFTTEDENSVLETSAIKISPKTWFSFSFLKLLFPFGKSTTESTRARTHSTQTHKHTYKHRYTYTLSHTHANNATKLNNLRAKHHRQAVISLRNNKSAFIMNEQKHPCDPNHTERSRKQGAGKASRMGYGKQGWGERIGGKGRGGEVRRRRGEGKGRGK